MSRGEVSDERATRVTSGRYEIAFPARHAERSLDQDEEWCVVGVDGEKRKIRFHDYHEIYALPGLYEQLFYEHLACASPARVVGLLARELDRAGFDPARLSALDVGAGNGMVGEELADIGAGRIVGIDIIPEAAAAAERDRPGVYERYFVSDLHALPAEVREDLEGRRLNALTCVAALGFGDIPPTAFAVAYDLVEAGGWLAFSIKEEFLRNGAATGFERLIEGMLARGMIEERAQERHLHRLSVAGDPLHYVAMVAVKRSDEPAARLAATV